METRQAVPSNSAAPPAPVKAMSVKKLIAALVGNPNTGKTTLFNALTGLRQHVGNYPGVTVEIKKGKVHCPGQTFDLIDLPGTYSLAPRSPDEMVAVDVILGRQKGESRPDVVVSIVDASNLERNLYLTTQSLELGVPVVLALNMIDVAGARASASTPSAWPAARRSRRADPGEQEERTGSTPHGHRRGGRPPRPPKMGA